MIADRRRYIPFMSQVTMNVEFVNSRQNPVDPDIVELHLGGAVYTSEVTRVGLGQYTYTMIGDTPGIYRRVWVGKNSDDSFYSESKPTTFIVQQSEVEA